MAWLGILIGFIPFVLWSLASINEYGSQVYLGLYSKVVNLSKDNTFIALTQSSELNVEDKDGRVIERYKIHYGTTLNFKTGSKIKQVDILAKWDQL